jgi:endonuclease-8
VTSRWGGVPAGDWQAGGAGSQVPEGDAVRRTARRLDAALAGGTLARADLRVPRFSTVDLRGMRVLGTHVVGKHLLTRLADDRRSLTLHHHLRMDGMWRTGPVGAPGAPTHQIRVWLATDARQAVGVRVHMVEVGPTNGESRWVGHLGPDVLAPDFDPVAAARRLAAAGRPLVESLLDQRLASGIGTMWAAELAHEAGADPCTPADQVPGLAEALGVTSTRMRRAVDLPAGVRRGELRVFERTGQPCRGCGTAIRATKVGVPPYQRPTYWCPRCQPPTARPGVPRAERG